MLFQSELKSKMKPGVFCGWQGPEPGLFPARRLLGLHPSLTLGHSPRWPASSSLQLSGILPGFNARTFDLTIPFLGDCLPVWVPREVSTRRGSVQPCLKSRRETTHRAWCDVLWPAFQPSLCWHGGVPAARG